MTGRRFHWAAVLLAGAATTGCFGTGTVGVAVLGAVEVSSVTATPEPPQPTAPHIAAPLEAGSAAAKTVATTPPRERLVIHAVGDVNLDPSYIPAFRSLGYERAFGGLDGLFVDDDLTIVNLECAASDLGNAIPKEFNFRCDTAALPVVAAAGIDVANLANNHSGDYGVDALLDSIVQVDASGMIPVGVGVDEAAAASPTYLDIDGWRVAVIGFGGVVPSPAWIADVDRPGMADGDDLFLMAATVAAAAERADVVIVVVHWGVELDTEPRSDDIARADAMIAAGADVILGSHPHRLQPLEMRDGAAVAWSLGNFVWPNFSNPGSDTAVARIIIEPDATIRACLLDATIVEAGHPTLDDPTTTTCADE